MLGKGMGRSNNKKPYTKIYLLKNENRLNFFILQFLGCHRYPSKEKSVRWVSLQAHITDNHCLHPKPEYNGRLLSATHLPLAKLQSE